jgi:peptidoglycan/xylan/chitin deacetylase (PgdA/CDA1 family)
MRKLAFLLLRYSGLPFLFREIIQRNKVSILLFHDISKETAEKTFGYLSRKYNILDLNDFIEACEKRNSNHIPKKAMIITFDDGHKQNYEMLPIIKKYNIPVTLFLCAAIVNSNKKFWFEFTHPSISKPELKRMPNKERLQIMAKFGFVPDKDFGISQALSKSQIDEMKDYINMQSHTMFHPILPQCDFDEAKNEIFKSKEVLENEFGLNINTIAYPNGDYSEREINLSKDANYKCGVTVDFGYNTINADLFRLKRYCSNDTSDLNELIVRASGLWAFLKTRNGKRPEIVD